MPELKKFIPTFRQPVKAEPMKSLKSKKLTSEEFVKTLPPVGQDREDYIYNNAEKPDKSEFKKVPVKDDHGNTVAEFKVMPDTVKVHGFRVPMRAETAQKLAQKFGLNLLTKDMIDHLHNAATKKLPPTPMSGGGRVGETLKIDNQEIQHMGGNAFIGKNINHAATIATYNDRIEKALQDSKVSKDDLVDYGTKYLIAPVSNKSNPNLYGMFQNGKPIQTLYDGHDTEHTEYATVVPMAGDFIINGKTVKLSEIFSNPEYENIRKYVSSTGSYNQYNSKPSVSAQKPTQPSSSKSPTGEQSKDQELKNKFLKLNSVGDIRKSFKEAYSILEEYLDY